NRARSPRWRLPQRSPGSCAVTDRGDGLIRRVRRGHDLVLEVFLVNDRAQALYNGWAWPRWPGTATTTLRSTCCSPATAARRSNTPDPPADVRQASRLPIT